MERLYVSKAYVNHREDYPESVTTYAALKGFALMGIETVPFYLRAELDDIGLTPETIVCGYVGDVRPALDVMGMPQPNVPDYPEQLVDFLGGAFGYQTWLGHPFRLPWRPMGGPHVDT